MNFKIKEALKTDQYCLTGCEEVGENVNFNV